MGALLIVNPQASRVTDELVERVAAELGSGVEVVFTEAPGQATTLVREREATVDAIYVLSGDGTFNEALNGVTGGVPFGFLPGGGTNVLPRALGLGRDPVAAARLAARGVPRPIGLGRVNGRRFSFSGGVGLDAELVRGVDQLGRRGDGRRPGDLAFIRVAARLVASRRGRFPPALEVEGHGRAAFALVANCDPYTYLGRIGLPIAPGASFDLGLDLVAPVSIRARDLPGFALAALRGASAGDDLIALHDQDRIVVRCDAPLPLQVDGEDLGDVEHAVFEAERGAVNALVPSSG